MRRRSLPSGSHGVVPASQAPRDLSKEGRSEMDDETRRAMLYEIKVRGHLGRHRLRSFEKLSVTLEASGETTIAAHIADQAALFGLLVRIRDLGVTLLSVRCLECTEVEPDAPANQRRSGQR